MTDIERLQAEVAELRTALADVAALAMATAHFQEPPNEFRTAHLLSSRNQRLEAIRNGRTEGAAELFGPEVVALLSAEPSGG